ncbi:MAG: acyl-CoA dehydrogenase [Deltaproteobacteria bacterium]|nr:acyl-CoA dehydrogenase [Deltaproteobacteria bacterium]MBM4299484.1 acyl-CoA dehydrogenase [Deltaproteobacteria bacterium]
MESRSSGSPLPFFDRDHVELRARVRAWVDAHLVKSVAVEADVEKSACALVKQLGAAGFLRYAAAKQYGGAQGAVEARDLSILREELARGSALADTMFALQALGSYPITLAGSDEQKQRYLPKVVSGEAIAAFAITEPEAGSDAAALSTTAVLDGERYRLNGTKRFISNAGIADHYVVFASTAPEQRAKGVSAFIVDATAPGLLLKEKTAILSPHPIGIIVFENCQVAKDALLGIEGEGLSLALRALDTLRISVAAAAVGLAQRALDEAVSYARERRQFGQAIGNFQGIQFKLADMATELEAARLLVYQAAWANDVGAGDFKQKSSMAKLYATEAAQRIIDQALQIHGGVGLVSGHIMERLYRDIRALRIYEGTSEIQKIVIARQLLKATGNRQ